MLLFKFKSYENCFNSKNTEMLFTYNNKNYVINLKFDKQSSYNLFYPLSEKEF